MAIPTIPGSVLDPHDPGLNRLRKGAMYLVVAGAVGFAAYLYYDVPHLKREESILGKERHSVMTTEYEHRSPSLSQQPSHRDCEPGCYAAVPPRPVQ